MKTASDLTIDGGPITVDLSKTVESEADGVKTSELRTSTVTLNVAWSNTEGWLVTVADAGQIDMQTNQIPVAPAEGADSPASVDPANTDLRTSGTSSSATRCRCRGRFRRWKTLRVFPPATTTPTAARRTTPTAACSWC